MMAIDARIPLGIQPVQIEGPLDQARKGMSLRALMTQSRLQEAELADRPAKNALALRKANLDLQSSELGLDTAKLDQIGKANTVLGQFATAVKAANYDQNAWQQGKQFLAANGAPQQILAALPEQVDQNVVEQLLTRSMTVADAIQRGDFKALYGDQQTPQPQVQQPGVQVQAMPVQTEVEGMPLAASAVPGQGPQSGQGWTTGSGAPAAPTPDATMRLANEDVIDKPPIESPDSLRAKAREIRKQGNKVAFDEAKRLEDDAARMESQILAQDGRDLQREKLALDKKQFEQKLRDDEKKAAEDQQKRSDAQGKEYFDRADKLRDDYRRDSKVFVDMRDAYSRIEASSKDPTAAGDLAMIFNYMKLLDPGSVVREGEFANAQNASGVPGRIIAYYNNVLKGERLAPDTRADFLDRSIRIYDQALANQKSIESQYRDFSTRAAVDPKDVVIDFRPNILPGKGTGAKTKSGTGTKTDPYRIQGDDGWSAIPKGSFYIAPDGTERQKR